MRLSCRCIRLGKRSSPLSHGVGALFGAAALVMLLWFCEKSLVNVVSVSIFGGTMILLSHGLHPLPRIKREPREKGVSRARPLAQSICSSQAHIRPSRCAALRAGRGIVMFAAVWAAAVLGIILNAVDMEKFKVVSMICYLMMGWVVVLAFNTVAAKNAGCGIKLPHRGRRGVHRRRGAVRPRQKSAVHARRVAPVCLSRQRAAPR